MFKFLRTYTASRQWTSCCSRSGNVTISQHVVECALIHNDRRSPATFNQCLRYVVAFADAAESGFDACGRRLAAGLSRAPAYIPGSARPASRSAAADNRGRQPGHASLIRARVHPFGIRNCCLICTT